MDACKERHIDFSGELNRPRLTDNESHNVSSTPDFIELFLKLAQRLEEHRKEIKKTSKVYLKL
jgi:hypothetical protein